MDLQGAQLVRGWCGREDVELHGTFSSDRLRLADVNAIIIWTSHSFGATNPNSSINMWIDPDGVSDVAPGGGSSSNLASIGIGLLFTYSGRVMVDQSIPRPIWYQ